MLSESIQGDEWDTSITLGRRLDQELRIAYRARAPRRRSLRSSPRPGKPVTWRREAGGPGRREPGRRNARDVVRRIVVSDREGGTSTRPPKNPATGEPCAVKVASTVRRGADGKGAERPPRRPPTLHHAPRPCSDNPGVECRASRRTNPAPVAPNEPSARRAERTQRPSRRTNPTPVAPVDHWSEDGQFAGISPFPSSRNRQASPKRWSPAQGRAGTSRPSSSKRET